MRPDPRHPCAIARVTQHRRDRLHRQRSVRRERAQEHRTTPAVPTRVTQARDEGLSDLAGEREPIRLAALAMDRQLPSTPVDVVERERGDLARAQPQTRQQHQDRVITPADRGRSVAASEDPRDVIAVQAARKRAQPPARDARDRRRQRDRNPPGDVQEHQQRPQPAHQRRRPRRPAAAIAALRHHKPRHITGTKLRQRRLDRIGQLAEEQPRDPRTQHDGPLDQPTLTEQVLAVRGHDRLRRRLRRERLGHEPQTTQVTQQRTQRTRPDQMRVALPPRTLEVLRGLIRQRGRLHALLVEPPAQVRHQPHLVLHRRRPVAALRQPQPKS
jgi:hypothetical protein